MTKLKISKSPLCLRGKKKITKLTKATNTISLEQIPTGANKIVENITTETRFDTHDRVPNQVLHSILGYMEARHADHMRHISKRIRDQCTLSFWEKFKIELLERTKWDASSVDALFAAAMNEAFSIYIRTGYGPMFYGSFMGMIRSSETHLIDEISKFIVNFFRISNTLMKSPQRYGLLYCLTLLNLLKKFNGFNLKSSKLISRQYRATIEISRFWLGRTLKSANRSIKIDPQAQYDERVALMAILSIMLYTSLAENSVTKIWEHKNDIYIFGRITDNNRRPLPKIIVSFSITSSHDICNLFHQLLTNKLNDVPWATEPPKDDFNAKLQLHCEEAVNYGCSNTLLYKFGPFTVNALGKPFVRMCAANAEKVVAENTKAKAHGNQK